MSRSKDAWADWDWPPMLLTPVDVARQIEEQEQRIRMEREGRELPPEPGDDRDDACPYCDSTNGFEAVGFGPDAPYVRCKNCSHMVTRG